MPMRQAVPHIGAAADIFEFYAGLAGKLYGESFTLPTGSTINLVKEPVGVVAAITPYNAALIMAFQKLVPALMAGSSVILRPSPLTPISSLVFGAAADAAGLPRGVLSVVIEGGADAARLLTTDPAVDMVSFTGSTAIGKQILVQAAPTVRDDST